MKFWLCLLIFPWLCWGDDNLADWETKSEEEALFLRRIVDFWQEGEYRMAKSQMEEFLTTHPNSAFTNVLSAALGDLLLREKNYASALDHYSTLKDPEICSRVFLNRMQCLYALGWYATLADECEAFLQKPNLQGIDPSQKIQASYYLAIALYQQCLNTKEPQVLLQLAQRARPHFESLPSEEWNDEVAAAFAHLCCILKEYPKASAIYLDLAQKDPDNEEQRRFQAALIQAEYDKALAAQTFEDIAQQGKTKAKEAAFNALVLSFEIGLYEKILEKREQFLDSVPEDRVGIAHLFFGRSFLAQKQYKEATESIRTYLTSAPMDATSHAALVSLIDAASFADDLSSLDFALTQLLQNFPQDPALSKGHFARALLLKKRQQIDAAKIELGMVIDLYPLSEEAPQAAFELTHLDFAAKAWSECRSKSRAFLDRFPKHNLAPYAWRHLVSSSAELVLAEPQNKERKETLVADLRALLDENVALSPEERGNWQFFLAKTLFELGSLEEAMLLLRSLIESKVPTTHEGDIYLLMAFCYRDVAKNVAHFCSFAEQAIEKNAKFLSLGSLHLSLFNAYLEQKEMPMAAKHLLKAFENEANIRVENILWLANHLYSRLPLDEITPGETEKVVALFEHLLSTHKDRPLFLEPVICKLGKLYRLLGRTEEGIALLEPLAAQQKSAPSMDWKCEVETDLVLAENYASLGKREEALHLFDAIAKETSSLRTFWGASACLQSARIRRAAWTQKKTSLTEGEKILKQLKNLILQKTLANEPIHLEAAFDYLDLQAGNNLSKRLDLLEKTKRDFESTEDLLSKDYHAARERCPNKNQIFQGYMRLIEAEILMIQAAGDTQKELQAKAKDLLLLIIQEKAHSTLVARARKRLDHGFVKE